MQYFFKNWNKIKQDIINKDIFLFLDYDGTLTPIVKKPNEAFLAKKTRDLLIKLKNKRIKIAIISGRKLKDVKNKVKINDLIYSGNHGLELEGSNVKPFIKITKKYAIILQKIKKELTKGIVKFRGTFIEDKDVTLSLHYRLLKNSKVAELKKIFIKLTKKYKRFIKTSYGKKVIEIKPPGNWNKGKIVSWLLKNNESFPIYIGDDTTDEDAFKSLKKIGLTIVVGKKTNSNADYYLKETNDVFLFLKKLKK